MITTLHGDCRQVLQTMPERSVQCVVTSPPYYGLRKYSDDPREIGQESAPDCLAWARREPPCGACYVCAMRDVFAQLWRVLRDDGVCFINLGDSYAATASARDVGRNLSIAAKQEMRRNGVPIPGAEFGNIKRSIPDGLKPKDLLGIPWRVALALQADGWYLRSDIVWAKPNCMPESVTDRPTRAHEYVFLLAKSARYFYDADAVREPHIKPFDNSNRSSYKAGNPGGFDAAKSERTPKGDAGLPLHPAGRNRRTVWSIATQPYPGSHYAVMPEALIEPCILAGSSAQACEHCGAAWVRVVERRVEGEQHVSPKDETGQKARGGNGIESSRLHSQYFTYTNIDKGFAPSCACPDNTGSAASVVLDPFGGSGTVARVALRLQRRAVLIELNQAYIEEHIEKRTDGLQVEMFV